LSETVEHNTQHLDEMTCLLYIEQQVDRARAQEISAHAQECTECRTLLRALERESRLLTRAMLEADEPLPARLAQMRESARRSMQWIWGVVVGLAATGAYALYTGYIEPWQQQLEQAGFGGSNLLGLLIFQGAFWKGWQSMITLIEVLALLIVGGFAAAFFRRRIRRGSALALVLAGFCAAVAGPAPASATEFRNGPSVEVGEDETIKGDVYLTGERVRIDGTVDGDVIIFCKSLEINGHVTGDVITFSQSARIGGTVDGNVRGANNNMIIAGTIGKNVMTFEETFTIDPTAKIGGSLTNFAQSLGMEGNVGRDALLFFEHGSLAGKIGGEVRAKGDSLAIGPTAEIGGRVRFEGHNEAEVSQHAKLAFPVEYKKMERKAEYRGSNYYVWRVIWTAAFVVFGLVVFLLLPKFAKETVRAGEQIGASAGLGVLVLFGVPIAAIIACITVVGLIVGISSLFLWLLMLIGAEIVVGAVVGQWLMGKASEIWPLIGRMVVGVIIVRLITTIPHVMFWTRLAVILWGMGAISLAIYRKLQPVIAPSVPSAPMAPPLPPNTTIGGVQPA
jgi:cytoskeletal protein CcmA (bactofilin family)